MVGMQTTKELEILNVGYSTLPVSRALQELVIDFEGEMPQALVIC